MTDNQLKEMVLKIFRDGIKLFNEFLLNCSPSQNNRVKHIPWIKGTDFFKLTFLMLEEMWRTKDKWINDYKKLVIKKNKKDNLALFFDEEELWQVTQTNKTSKEKNKWDSAENQYLEFFHAIGFIKEKPKKIETVVYVSDNFIKEALSQIRHNLDDELILLTIKQINQNMQTKNSIYAFCHFFVIMYHIFFSRYFDPSESTFLRNEAKKEIELWIEPISKIKYQSKMDSVNVNNLKKVKEQDCFLKFIDDEENFLEVLQILLGNRNVEHNKNKIKIDEIESLLWAHPDEADEIIESLKNSDNKIAGEEIERIVKTRKNQQVFRERILEKYKKCIFTEIETSEILIASHIVPWRDSDSYQKLSSNNGLLLSASVDKLFDSYLISIDNELKIYISNKFKRNKNYLDVLKKIGIKEEYLMREKELPLERNCSELRENLKQHYYNAKNKN